MNRSALIEELQEAQNLIEHAASILESVANADRESREWARAYLINHLRAIGTTYLRASSRKAGFSQSIEDWIERLQASEEPEEELEA